MRRYFLFCVLLLLSAGAHACQPIDCVEFESNVGPLFNFARYEIGCLPRIQGYLAGLHFDFELRTKWCVYSRLEFDGRWNAGFVCGCPDTQLQIRDYRPQWFLGYSFCVCDSIEISPFTGFGFYYLFNEFKCDILTYRYFNIFVPVGLRSEWEVKEDCFYIGLAGLYRPDVWTRVKVETPCIDVCACEKIKLKRTHGVHVEMPMRWEWQHPCTDKVDFQTKVVPFFDWNRFGQADEANCNCICIGIPQLDRWYLGLHIDLGIQF